MHLLFKNLEKLILILFTIIFALFIDVKSGDSSIYLTFIKNFFDLPFSYYDGVVSYGASSPLFVFINAILTKIYNADLFGMRFINFSFLFLAVYIQKKTLKVGINGFLILLIITISNIPLLRSTGALFESSLVYLAMSVLFYTFLKSEVKLLITTAALLPLIRPELIILSIFIFIEQLVKTNENKMILFRTILLSLLPLLIYCVWMYLHTNTLIPTSVEARAIKAMDLGNNYFERLLVTAKSLFYKSNLIYGILFVGTIFALFKKQMTWKEYAFIILPVIPYLISPPGYDASRYFLPSTAVATLFLTKLLVVFFEKLFPQRRIFILLFTLCSILPAITYKMSKESERYDYNTLLLKPLANFLNSYIKEKNDNILLYEIQGQYYINNRCYSLDGIVGQGESFPFLRKEISFKDILDKYNIKYIVTLNSFAFRKVFQGTALVPLYQHDLNSLIGESISIEDVVLKKITSNPNFYDSKNYQEVKFSNLNHGDFLRINNYNPPQWGGQNPMWNSVYEIIGKQ